MDEDDKLFIRALGKRIAACRKACGLTQAQVGEKLGFTQPHIQAFESGRRRISVTDLPKLADLLGVSVEELLGLSEKPGRRGRPSMLQRQFEQASRLSRKQQQFVAQVMDAVLLQAKQAS